MRLSLISTIRIKHAVVFATVLFLVQALEHTEMIFAALTFTFVLVSTLAFNAAGGFVYPSGWFIFFNAMLTALMGLSYKALLGEPAQTHLKAPNVTMLVYCLSMVLIWIVAMLSRKLIPRRGLLAGMGFGDDMKKAALGAFLLGACIQALTYTTQESGTLLSALRQINFFTQMGVLLGTFYQVKKSGGRESSNYIVWASGAFIFVTNGLLSFSKFGLLVSVVTWLATAVVAGYHFNRREILLIVSFLFFFQAYLVPYSQVGRNLREEDATLRDDIKTAAYAVPHMAELRSRYLQDQLDQPEDDSLPRLYDHAQGFWDRLNMLAPDDALIAYTLDGHEEGLLPTWWSVLNIVPHFVWKDKPFFYIGNMYAREIGMIAEENDVTGVSFSPAADAFHQAGFFGLFLLVPAVLFILFMVMDSLSGDIRESPWGILFCVACTHSAPEGLLGGQVYISTYVAFGVIVVAFLSKWVLPPITGVITNNDRTRPQRTMNFKPAPRAGRL